MPERCTFYSHRSFLLQAQQRRQDIGIKRLLSLSPSKEMIQRSGIGLGSAPSAARPVVASGYAQEAVGRRQPARVAEMVALVRVSVNDMNHAPSQDHRIIADIAEVDEECLYDRHLVLFAVFSVAGPVCAADHDPT